MNDENEFDVDDPMAVDEFNEEFGSDETCEACGQWSDWLQKQMCPTCCRRRGVFVSDLD